MSRSASVPCCTLSPETTRNSITDIDIVKSLVGWEVIVTWFSLVYANNRFHNIFKQTVRLHLHFHFW